MPFPTRRGAPIFAQMDLAVTRSRIVDGLSQWVRIDPNRTLCVDEEHVHYGQVDSSPPYVRVPEESLFPMNDDGPWATFLDGGSPWIHANLVLTADGSPILTLSTQSLANGRQPSGTYAEIAVNVSFQNQSVAEIVPTA